MLIFAVWHSGRQTAKHGQISVLPITTTTYHCKGNALAVFSLNLPLNIEQHYINSSTSKIVLKVFLRITLTEQVIHTRISLNAGHLRISCPPYKKNIFYNALISLVAALCLKLHFIYS